MVLNRRFALLALVAFAGIAVAQDVPPPTSSHAGVVRLSRAEYDKLKDAAEAAMLAPPKKRAPEPPPLLESASYDVRVEGDRIAVEVTADVNVRPPATDARLAFPIPGLLDAFADKGPAPVAFLGGEKPALLFPKPGRYHLTARFLPYERREGDRRVAEFDALAASSAKIAAAPLPSGAELAFTAGAGRFEEPLLAGSPKPIPSSAFVRLYLKTPARIPTTVEKPVLIAETLDVVRPERERVTTRTLVRLTVSRAELEALRIALPPGSEVVSVAGPEDPAFRVDSGTGLVTVVPTRRLYGEAALSILSFRPAPKEGEPLEATPARVLDAASNRAYLLVSPTALREQSLVSANGLARADVADLPVFSRPFSESGTRAYRVTDPASAKLVLNAPLRQASPLPDPLISQATLLTVFGDGGSRTDRRRFVVETKRPLFLTALDASEEVLSVSVDGNPVTPKKDGDSLAVLLPKSRAEGRVIDITTKRKGAAPSEKGGDFTVEHPRLPGTASLATWTVVLPETWRYRFVSSTGIRKAGWSQDAPAEVTRYRADTNAWLAGKRDAGDDRKVEESIVAVAEAPAVMREPMPRNLPGQKQAEAAGRANEKDEDKGRQESAGLLGHAPAPPPATISGDISLTMDGSNALQNQAGVKSLPMDVTGHGKRLTLSGPNVGSEPLSVTLKVKK